MINCSQEDYDLMVKITTANNYMGFEISDLISYGVDGLIKSHEKYNPELGEFKKFAGSVITCEIKNGIKKISREKIKTINIDEVSMWLEDPTLGYSDLLILMERNHILHSYIFQLNKTERKVIILNFFDNLKLKDISKKLNLSLRSISKIKNTAIKKLKKKINNSIYF